MQVFSVKQISASHIMSMCFLDASQMVDQSNFFIKMSLGFPIRKRNLRLGASATVCDSLYINGVRQGAPLYPFLGDLYIQLACFITLLSMRYSTVPIRRW